MIGQPADQLKTVKTVVDHIVTSAIKIYLYHIYTLCVVLLPALLWVALQGVSKEMFHVN